MNQIFKIDLHLRAAIQSKWFRAFFFSGLFLTLLSVSSFVIFGNPPEKAKPVDLHEFMIQKRAFSQIVLDGLMSEDYQTIILVGENMRRMRADKRWERLVSDDYKRYSEDFENSAQTMVDSARRRNLDACMSSYIRCLQSCYNCHKYVRALPVPTSFKPKP